MKLPQNTFREYDVRGIAGKELTGCSCGWRGEMFQDDVCRY
jgi:hypothetical protein